MADSSLSIAQLNKIIRQTIEAIEHGKQQIFEIAEGAREEYRQVEKELSDIKQRTREIIKQVDELEKQDKKARMRLMVVSRDFCQYSEDDIRDAYQEALETGTKVALAREMEKQLRLQRDSLERRLQNIRVTVQRAEALTVQVSTAIDVLAGNLNHYSVQLENIQQRQQLNVKIIKAQEEERRRVAREIHDGPAQSIANVMFRVEICEKLLENDCQAAKQELQELKCLLRGTLQDVRRIIFGLRPMALDDLGLIPTLRRMIEDFKERTQIETNFLIFGNERRLHQAIEVTTFRLIQEALNNCEKHAQAQKVKVKIQFLPRSLTLVVEDDGKGFEWESVQEKLKKSENFGLIGMQERVELLDGKFNIKTAPGQGTKIIIQLPVQE